MTPNDERFDRIDAALERMSQRFDGVDGRQDRLMQQRVDFRHEFITRLDGIDSRLRVMTEGAAKLEQTLSKLVDPAA